MDDMTNMPPETPLPEEALREAAAIADGWDKVGAAIRTAKTVGDLVKVAELVDEFDAVIEGFL